MKVKRHISILLTALILFSNIGLALNVRYCHGAVSSVSVAYRLKDSCAEVKKQPQKSCCAAVVKTSRQCCKSSMIKLHDKADGTAVKALQLNLSVFCSANAALFIQPVSGAVTAIKNDTPSFYCDGHAPPLYNLYCQYIFYA